MLDQITKDQVSEELKSLKNPVKLIAFTQKEECRYCEDARVMAEEIASTSSLLSVEVLDFVKDKKTADQLGIDKIPALAVMGSADYGIRFFGLPGGYEFTSLIEAIKTAGSSEQIITADSIAALQKLKGPVYIQVFVTPT